MVVVEDRDDGYLSSVQNSCWLMIIASYTPPYIGDYHNSLSEY
jgi:hypothetical protein